MYKTQPLINVTEPAIISCLLCSFKCKVRYAPTESWRELTYYGTCVQTLMQAVFQLSNCFWAQENWCPKKYKQVFSKIGSIFKGLCTLLHCSHIHNNQIAAKIGTFTHFTSTNVSQLSPQYYMFTIDRPPAAFYEYLIKVVIAPHLTTAAPKICLVYVLQIPIKQSFINNAQNCQHNPCL